MMSGGEAEKTVKPGAVSSFSARGVFGNRARRLALTERRPAVKTRGVPPKQRRKTMNAAADRDDARSAEQAGAASATEAQKTRGAAADQTAGGNVDKIRDILFGSQMRDYESRFLRLEETLTKEVADLKESNRKRFEALEAYLRRELESLQGRLKAEREERSDAGKLLSREIKEVADTLGKKIAEADDHVTEAHGQLRADMLQQSKDLRDELRQAQDEMASALERRFKELRTDKADRALLADLLTEVALRLKDEFRMPAAAAG
jgi:hypothetical protein